MYKRQLLQSLIMLATDDMSTGVRYGLIGGVAGFAATALGALPALFLRSVPQRVLPSLHILLRPRPPR
ncbi:hypothetical protein ACQ4LF_23280, partial [Aeromonas salmonicida]